MKAKQIADLIGLVDEDARSGRISFDAQLDLKAALWEVATKEDIREEVDALVYGEIDVDDLIASITK